MSCHIASQGACPAGKMGLGGYLPRTLVTAIVTAKGVFHACIVAHPSCATHMSYAAPLAVIVAPTEMAFAHACHSMVMPVDCVPFVHTRSFHVPWQCRHCLTTPWRENHPSSFLSSCPELLAPLSSRKREVPPFIHRCAVIPDALIPWRIMISEVSTKTRDTLDQQERSRNYIFIKEVTILELPELPLLSYHRRKNSKSIGSTEKEEDLILILSLSTFQKVLVI